MAGAVGIEMDIYPLCNIWNKGQKPTIVSFLNNIFYQQSVWLDVSVNEKKNSSKTG